MTMPQEVFLRARFGIVSPRLNFLKQLEEGTTCFLPHLREILIPSCPHNTGEWHKTKDKKQNINPRGSSELCGCSIKVEEI